MAPPFNDQAGAPENVAAFSIAYRLVEFGPGKMALAREMIKKYPGLDLGLTDASLVVLAESLGVRDLLTLDERHLRAVRGQRGEAIRIFPADLQQSDS